MADVSWSDKGSSIASAFENAVGQEISVENGLMLASSIVRNDKAKQVLAWSSVGYVVGRRIWNYVKSRDNGQREYHIKIDEDDDLYDTVCGWFIASIPEEQQYSVEAETESYYVRGENGTEFNDHDDEAVDDLFASISGSTSTKSSNGYQYRVGLRYSETQVKEIEVAGHVIGLQHIIPGSSRAKTDDDDDYTSSGRGGGYSFSRSILIICDSLVARRAIIKELEATIKQPEFAERQPSFYQATSFGEFRSSRDIPLRKIESVVLKDGQIETIVRDITRFLDAEDRYADLDYPYHRGILLHGAPGTGKTSIAAAIANHLKLDVYYISLGSIKDNNALGNLLQGVRSRSLLLLEEIDICKATNENGRGGNDGNSGITMDGLLQALDGFTAPHGLVTIMTTNKIEVLDEALIRSGRADLKLEITTVDKGQVERMCQQFIKFVPEGLPEVEVRHGIAPSDIVEVFKQNIYNNEAAGADLVKVLTEKVLEAELKATELDLASQDSL